MLGFDSYASMSDHLTTILGGGRVASHAPADRRKRLPLSPAARPRAAVGLATPGHGAPGAGARATPTARRSCAPASTTGRGRP